LGVGPKFGRGGVAFPFCQIIALFSYTAQLVEPAKRAFQFAYLENDNKNLCIP